MPGAPMDHAQPHSWPARNWSTMPGLGFRVVAPESNRQTWNHGSTTAIVCRKMSTLSTLARTTPAAATTRMTACSSASVERTITSPLSGVAKQHGALCHPNVAQCVWALPDDLVPHCEGWPTFLGEECSRTWRAFPEVHVR